MTVEEDEGTETMTIVLTYTTKDGSQGQVEFKDDVVEIDLSLQLIASIDLSSLATCANLQVLALHKSQHWLLDLSPLATCTSLLELNLSDNQFQILDLTPLATCTNLRKLDLYENQFTSLDLSPLATCTSLLELYLGCNQLWALDLTPLATCTNLRRLDLSHNQLWAPDPIDLTPLATCTNLQELWLNRNQLPSIDLTPLTPCINLLKLNLSGNQFTSLDLSPLTPCTNLRYLNLSGNQFQILDLSPLTPCTNLRYLYLSGNQLTSLDLSPLATCINLLKLNLSENQFTSLDLTPLATCTNLQYLWLNRNQLTSLDLTPLATCTNLQRLSLSGNQLQSSDAVSSWLEQVHAIYRRPVSSYPWSFLCKTVEQFGTDHRVQQDILYALGLKHYGFIDCDLSDLFRSIPADTPIELAHEQVRERLLEDIPRIIETGGATTGLNVEELSTHHGELAKSMQRVIDLREAEMQRVSVGVRDTEADIRELWLTAYGYKILTALDMRLTTDLEGLEQVRKALAELGFQLKTGDTSVPGVKMSDELREAIWWIAENRGRPWSEIEGE